MNYQFKINDFEGPLDLLLHLVKESKMDITFELEPDITLDTLDFKYGNNLKIQYHYYLKKNSKLNIIKS